MYTETNAYYLNEQLQDWLHIIQHHIPDFTWQNKEEWAWIWIRWFSQSCSENMGIRKLLGGPMQSFQCNDIMAYNTKEEDDVLFKYAEYLRKLYGRWKTKQEMGKWRTEWREWHYPLMVVSITSMRNPNSYPYILTNSNLFQPNAEGSTGCPNDAAMCKSFLCVEKT